MVKALKNPSVAGSIVSFLIGLVVWLVTHDAPASLIIAIVGSILSFQFELREMISDSTDRLMDALKLTTAVIAEEGLRNVFFEIVNAYIAVKRINKSFVTARADERLIEFAGELSRLATGSFYVDEAGVHEKGMNLIRQAKKMGFATSLVKAKDFWEKDIDNLDVGLLYHQENLKAAKRGVHITRVFILEDRGSLNHLRIRKVVLEQFRAGIEVRVAFLDHLPPELREDFGIWDNETVCKVNVARDSSKVVGAAYETSASELLRANRLRERLMKESLPVAEALPDDPDFQVFMPPHA